MTMLHPAWMGKGLRMSNARTPEETAHWEASQFFDGREERVRLVPAEMPEEAYEILETEEGYLVQGGKTGLLYGVYALIFALRSRMEVPQGRKEPYCQVRMLQCWDNMDAASNADMRGAPSGLRRTISAMTRSASAHLDGCFPAWGSMCCASIM